MNPAIVIPSYWTSGQQGGSFDGEPPYDHATFVKDPYPQLEPCLSSLDNAHGVFRVVILLVADAACEPEARVRVEAICGRHPRLSPLLVASREAACLGQAVAGVAPGLADVAIALRGYGSIRNLGLAVSAVLGHDFVIFLDDDEVAVDDNFLVDAIYGLGLTTRQGLPIVAKTGYYLDGDGSPYADVEPPRWRDRPWSKREEFNALMRHLLEGKRISRTSYVCGGCFALASEAYRKVGFDPLIPRGEDLDYLFNLRMNGLDVWFDKQWRVRHYPPRTTSPAARFVHDVRRWEYERRKLETINATIGLHHVTADSLEPYPGSWVGGDADRRATATSLRRLLAGPERGTYARLLLFEQRRARAWARAHASSYLAFQTHWPRIMDALWDNRDLARRLVPGQTPRGRRPGDDAPPPVPPRPGDGEAGGEGAAIPVGEAGEDR